MMFEPRTDLVAPPELTDDDRAFFAKSHCADSVRFRILTERAIARKTAQALIAAGFFVRVHDGEDWACERTTKLPVIMAAIMATDEETLHVYREDTGAARYGWVQFVYGNGGWDVTSDHTTNLEEVLQPVSDYAEQLSAWC
jgi:hypothetical protein